MTSETVGATVFWVLMDEVPETPQPIGVFEDHDQARAFGRKLGLRYFSVIGVTFYKVATPCSG